MSDVSNEVETTSRYETQLLCCLQPKQKAGFGVETESGVAAMVVPMVVSHVLSRRHLSIGVDMKLDFP